MKKQTLIIAGISILLGIGFTSCKKKGCMDETATNYNSSATQDDGSCEYGTTPTASAPGSYTPSFTGEFGALVAIKTVTTTTAPIIGEYDIELGTAVAAFSNDGGNSFMTAGTVNVDGNNLAIQSNNSYIFTPSQTAPTGIVYGANVAWAGTGASWNSFNASTSQGFSAISQITSSDVTTSSSYTLTSNSITNADSLVYSVYGPSGSKTVVVAGSNTSHTFSAADLSGIGTGTGFVQIVGVNYDPQTISSKTYYLLNETVRTKQVNIN